MKIQNLNIRAYKSQSHSTQYLFNPERVNKFIWWLLLENGAQERHRTRKIVIPRIKIVINWASHNDDLNEQSVLIRPKFKNEFQIPAAADTMSLNLKPCKFTTILLKKDVGPTCRATVGMRIKAATFQTYNRNTSDPRSHLSVELLCLEMAGKFHCVTRKIHKFSSPTNPEV